MNNQLRFFLFLLLMGVFITACSNRPDGVLSPRKMRQFLVELHQLEAVMANAPQSISEREQVYYYNSLLVKHGISKADFDSSLVFYTKNPKVFERIYGGVVQQLEARQNDVAAGKFHPALLDSTYFKSLRYDLGELPIAFSSDSTQQSLAFVIRDTTLMTSDIYHWHFRLRIAPRDTSENLYAALRIHYADGVVDSVAHPAHSDSILRRFRFTVNAKRNLKVDSISGIIPGGNNHKELLWVHIDSILLQREYRPAIQDSLRLQLSTLLPADSIVAATDTMPTTIPDNAAPTELKPVVEAPRPEGIITPGPGRGRPVDDRIQR